MLCVQMRTHKVVDAAGNGHQPASLSLTQSRLGDSTLLEEIMTWNNEQTDRRGSAGRDLSSVSGDHHAPFLGEKDS